MKLGMVGIRQRGTAWEQPAGGPLRLALVQTEATMGGTVRLVATDVSPRLTVEREPSFVCLPDAVPGNWHKLATTR